MYIPKDRSSRLELPKHDEDETKQLIIQSIVSNRQHNFIAVATSDALYIWQCNPQVLLCSIAVLDEEWKNAGGEFRKIYWRHDSEAIAVTTNHNKIFIYDIVFDMSSQCYNFVDSNDPYHQRTSAELFGRANIPAVKLNPGIQINVADVPTCCIPLESSLMFCLQNGYCHTISWNGVMDMRMSFHVNELPFSFDQMRSKSDHVKTTKVHIVDAVYAPLMGGYSVVLSDGKAALITSETSEMAPKDLLGIWAPNLKNATCCAVNHKFLMTIYGCRDGDVCAFNLDEQTGGLSQVFRVAPKVSNGPDFSNRLGPVHSIKMCQNEHGFAACWAPKAIEETESGSSTSDYNPLPRLYAVFTPFGAQSFCNLEGVSDDSYIDKNSAMYTAMEWGPEGYQLWLGSVDELHMQPFMRNAACGRPIMEHADRAVMMSDSDILLSGDREKEADACAPHAVWDHISIRHEYLSANWPIRHVSMDPFYKHLVVAGTNGFAYCSLTTRKWKMFGNENHEQRMVITGGVFIWKNNWIGAVGIDAETDSSFAQFFKIGEKLNWNDENCFTMPKRPLMIAVRDDALAVFTTEGSISVFRLEMITIPGRTVSHKVNIHLAHEILLRDLIPHPSCVVSIQMTQLHMDKSPNTNQFYHNVDTVLINIAGKLISLSIGENREKPNPPFVIASYVERIWHDRCATTQTVNHIEEKHGHRRTASNISMSSVDGSPQNNPGSYSTHLRNALWIACGAKGLRVWMPLVPGRKNTSTQELTFIAKRIMLPFELDIYPIVICARNCLAIGVESQLQHVLRASNDDKTTKSIEMYSLHRNSEVFVHHLLRQLLKRNLGVFALELASAFRALPHFTHALELLLHSVLEEEATSSEPIPDPLLPRCVAFIHEFPEFLKTIAHCTRKTELALWPTLFDVTGSPNALFEECLQRRQLENAASFVIVLQNFETTETSIEQAARLVREALIEKKWSIAKEMIRFASSIGSEDIDTVTPPPSAKTSVSRRPTVSSQSEQLNEIAISRFQAGGAGRLSKVRHTQSTEQKDATSRKDSIGSTTKEKTTLSRGLSGELSPTMTINRLAAKMNVIIEDHCWHLLNNYSILDLGYCWNELRFDILSILEVRRKQLCLTKQANPNCYIVDDFPLALTRLHAQFKWPYPVCGAQFMNQLEKKLGNLKLSQSTASLNGLLLNGNSEQKTPKIKTNDVINKTKELADIRTADEADDESDDVIEIQQALLKRVEAKKSEVESDNSRSPTNSISASVTNGGITTMTPASSDSRSLAGDYQSTDYLVGEKSSRGNSASNAQLEYLLHIFSQSSTIDWIFLICLLRRDENRFRQELCPSIVRRAGEKNFARIRLACTELGKWAIEKCPGYIELLKSLDAHLAVVAEQCGISDLKVTPQPKKTNGSTSAESKTRVSRVSGSSYKGPSTQNRRGRSKSVDRVLQKYDVAQPIKTDDEGCLIM